MIVEEVITPQGPGLSAEKQALLEKRLRGGRRNPAGLAIPRLAERSRAPLSSAQQRLWFLNQLEPGSPLYNIPAAIRLRGPLDHEALQWALNAVMARHEALRTRFEAEDGNPVQVTAASAQTEIPIIDLSSHPVLDRERELHRLLEKEARRPFDLSIDLLVRTLLLRLGETEHVLSITLHHIICDAWSLGILFRELGAFYEAICEGRELSLPELKVQYADYAAWQRSQADGGASEKHLAYWKQHLAGAPYFLELPADKPRPPLPSSRGAHVERLLPKPLFEKLRQFGRAEGATPFMTLLAAFTVLLHRYTRQAHFIVGSPVAGRTWRETEALIGFFVNTLALHADLSGDPTFCEVLARTRHAAMDGFAHQDLPFERLVEELQPARDTGSTPLLQVLFTFQNNAAREFKLPEVTIEPVEVDTGTAKFHLTLGAEELPDGLLLEAEYNTDIFAEETIARMLGHFQTLLEGIAADPRQRISRLSLLAEDERGQFAAGWKASKTNYPRDKTIPKLFEEQVRKTPDSPAVVFGAERISYFELNERADQLAQELQNIGVGAGEVVGLCVERSVGLIVALVGVLKAGAAYTSLDPAHPTERLKSMLADAQVRVVLTSELLRERFNFEVSSQESKVGKVTVLRLEAGWKSFTPGFSANAGSPAYVSFTSGSTGRPKGVVVPHRGVVRLVRETNFARFKAEDVFLQLAPVAFDASTFEIWGALLNGATLVVFPPHTPSLAELGDFIQKNRITILWLTSGLFNQMVEEQLSNLRGVRQLLAGGDVLSVAHVRRALENLPDCEIINGYGPTENTTFTCCHQVTLADCECRSIPIGRPVANTEVYVLDEHLQPLPIGVPGELCIGGDGLALGYLNQLELQAKKFVPQPFSNDGERLYKTGDLARWLPDGNIEFFGRIDHQIKIRGFRVEPGEIETVLNEHPGVRECAVVAYGEQADHRQLAAYFVAGTTPAPNADELRAHLRKRLPDYMIPATFAPLKSLPLNGNGKVDRRALAPAERQVPASAQAFVPPRDELETKLARIWEDVLETPRVGIEDHFFELGGHSLLAVKLVARIEKAFGRKIPVAAIFQSPTVAQLAKALRERSPAAASSSIVEIQPKGSRPPLFLVHGAGGGMLWGYTNLSRHLGPDQPIFAFNSRGLNGQDEFTSIEEMAAQYAADLRGYQPCGPYFLGGYCFGGDIAYEMGRQLEAQGEKVALLALMNCAPPNSSYARIRWTPGFALKFLRNLCQIVVDALQGTRKQKLVFFRWATRSLQKKVNRLIRWRRAGAQQAEIEKLIVDAEEALELPPDARPLWNIHLHALIAYHPKPYRGKVALFRSRSHPPLCSFDRQCGWGELAAGGVTVTTVPGSHENILDEPHVGTVAKALKVSLDEIHGGPSAEGKL